MGAVLPNDRGWYGDKRSCSHPLDILVPPSYIGVCTYGERQFVAPDDPDAGDAAVVVFAKQDDTSKGIFSELVQALEHAWNTIGSSGSN